MTLFQIKDENKLARITETPFKLEKDIQNLTEANLHEIFGIEFVRSEFALNNFRIDSLAFDTNSNSFVIIEYKRDKNFSVIDQGFAYLSLMLNNKADFILEYNENCQNTLKRDDVDWSQSKVIFISPSFTSYQREAINFKDLPIELWEIKRYENKTVAFNQIKSYGSKESINTVSKKNETIEQVSKEIKVFTEQELVEKANDEIKELYEKLKLSLLSLGDIEMKATKLYVAFISSGSNIVAINIQKTSLKIWLNAFIGEINDSQKLFRDVSKIGHWGNGDYEVQIKDDEYLEYILSLVKQVLTKKK